MHLKTFTLISGQEDEFYWSITAYIFENKRLVRQNIHIRDQKEKYQKYKTQMNIISNKWAMDHPGRRRELERIFYENNREKCNKWSNDYIKTPKGKEVRKGINRRSKAKRKQLGFIELNDWFEDADAHHVDKNHVIYIPKVLHNSIYHNLSTGQGMAQINAKAFQYLFGNN